jgi:pimeloyl-ACP methyl ester carboxylesterase
MQRPARKAARRWKRSGLVIALGLPALWLILHGVSWAFGGPLSGVAGVTAHSVRLDEDSTLRVFEKPAADAVCNIVFIHGTPGSAAHFKALFREPFPGANLIALDRPGFGGSHCRHWQAGLEAQADAVGMLLRESPPLRTLLLGHSYGAPVALKAALRHPDQVAGVVLIGGCVDPAQERVSWGQRVANWPSIAWLLPRSLRRCNRELLGLRDELEQLGAELPALRVPVVMLHGDCDRLVPVANVAYLKRLFAAAGMSGLFEERVLEGRGHFIPWQDPDAVRQAIAFVAARAGAAGHPQAFQEGPGESPAGGC